MAATTLKKNTDTVTLGSAHFTLGDLSSASNYPFIASMAEGPSSPVKMIIAAPGQTLKKHIPETCDAHRDYSGVMAIQYNKDSSGTPCIIYGRDTSIQATSLMDNGNVHGSFSFS